MDGATFGREEGTVYFPASLPQTRFWLLEELDPGKPALNVAVQWTLLGSVTPVQAEAAWARVIDRHEILRTGLVASDGVPLQVVHHEVSFRVTHYDLSSLPEPDRLAEVERLGRDEARIPFVLQAAPLMRVSLIRTAPSVSRMLLTLHHTVCDGWSIGILAEEFTAALAGVALPALSLQYGDYAEWQRVWVQSPDLSFSRTYWTQQLADLPYSMVPPDQSSLQRGPSAIISTLVPSETTAEMGRIAGRHGCTSFTIATAALGLMLKSRIGSNDIAIGTQVANRNDIELESLIGCFINTIVLRLDLSCSADWDDLISQVTDVVTSALQHGSFPFEMLIQALRPKREPGRTPLYSVNLIFQRSFVKPTPREDVVLVDMPSYSAGALYDLNFFMVERPGGWRASCEYDTARYQASTVQAMLNDWVAALAGTSSKSTSTVQAGDRLATIWQEVLGLDNVNLDDDFFDVGGHSLLAARLLSRIEAEFGRRVSMAELFAEPTFGGLARRLGEITPNTGFVAVAPLELQQTQLLAIGSLGQWQMLDQVASTVKAVVVPKDFSAPEVISFYPASKVILLASNPDASAAIALASSLEQHGHAVVLALVDAVSPRQSGFVSRLRRTGNSRQFAGRTILFCRSKQAQRVSQWSGQLEGPIDVINLPDLSWEVAMAQHLKAVIG